jgi:hypothetical protein
MIGQYTGLGRTVLPPELISYDGWIPANSVDVLWRFLINQAKRVATSHPYICLHTALNFKANNAHFRFRLLFACNELVPLAFLVSKRITSRTDILGELFEFLT